MDEHDGNGELGERLRTWRMFVTYVRWIAAVAALLFLLLVFRTHG